MVAGVRAVADGVDSMPLRPLVASSRCRRLLYWPFVHIFIAGVFVVPSISFTGRLVTFVTELDRLGDDL